MKSTKLLLLAPPLIALAIVGTWIRNQQAEIGKARGKIAAGEEGAHHRGERSSASSEPRIVDPEKSGWKPFALQMWSVTTSGDPASRKMLTAHLDRIRQMSVPELLAALDKVKGESFGNDEAQNRLLSTFCRELCEKDPVKLLEYVRVGVEAGRLNDGWSLREALGKVAATSPRQAIAWMDEVIAKGVFDYSGTERYNPQWLAFEKALMFGMLPVDPILAEQRVAGLPADARPRVVRDDGLFFASNPGAQPAYIRFCRKFLDADEMIKNVATLADQAAATGGTTAVSHILSQIETTPRERSTVVNQVVSNHMQFVQRSGKPDLKTVEDFRAWATTLAPGDVEKATGDALGWMAGSPDFGVDQAFDAVRRYHEKSGSDALLAEFLGWPAVWRSPDKCTELAGQIRNEKLRKKSMTEP